MNEFQESIRNHLNDAEGLRIFAKELVNRAFLAGLWKPENERSKMIEDAVEQLFKEIEEVSGVLATIKLPQFKNGKCLDYNICEVGDERCWKEGKTNYPCIHIKSYKREGEPK